MPILCSQELQPNSLVTHAFHSYRLLAMVRSSLLTLVLKNWFIKFCEPGKNVTLHPEANGHCCGQKADLHASSSLFHPRPQCTPYWDSVGEDEEKTVYCLFSWHEQKAAQVFPAFFFMQSQLAGLGCGQWWDSDAGWQLFLLRNALEGM